MSFADDVVAGRADADDLDDYVAAWHDGAGEDLSLHAFLGMDFETYARIMPNRAALEEHVAALRSATG